MPDSTNAAGSHNSRGYHYYIPCRVEPGMFKGEWLVFVEASDPGNPEKKLPVQVLVDQRDVERLEGTPKRREPATGWLRVELADASQGFARIVLPQPSEPLGESLLVSKEQVQEVAV